MKSKFLLFSAAFASLAALFPTQLEADVEVVGLMLGGTGASASYTVPSGKVLLVENLSASYASNVPSTSRIILEIHLLVQNGGISTMRFGYPVADKFTAAVLARPLRVPSGRVISLYTDSNLGYNECRLQGLLVDQADLYAANIDVELTPVGVGSGRFKAEAVLASARPARVETMVSTDLATFSSNATEEKHRLEPAKWMVSTAADSGKKFLVARATAMETPPIFPTTLQQ